MSEFDEEFDMLFGDPVEDGRWMDYALALGRRGIGTTAPNPSVGCVLVNDGVVVGVGWTQPGGRPHAETEALRRAGERAAGATVYVSLEPCAHHGKTPPCTDALIAAKVARVVTACLDPDERVRGLGIDRIAAEDIHNESWSGDAAAEEDLGGYLTRQIAGRPRISLKVAASLDGRIATAGGDSQWITGQAARHRGHALRATHDAVLIGSETALADDPALTCRLPGIDRPSTAIVLDSRGRLPPTSTLVRQAVNNPLIHITTQQAVVETADKPGVTIQRLPATASGRPDPTAVAELLGQAGFNDVLIEGGGQVAAAFLRAGLVDRLFWFRAGLVMGGDARPAVGDLNLGALAEAGSWRASGTEVCGTDRLEIWNREPRAFWPKD